MRLLRHCLFAMTLASPALLAQDYDTLIQQALRQRDDANLTGAEQTLRQARELATDKTEASQLLGMVLAFEQKFGEALDVLDAALKQNPGSIDLQLARARVLSYQGVYQEAMTTVEQVLVKQPDNAEALSLAGRIAYYQKRPTTAQLYFSQVLEHDLDNLDALLGMYDTYLQLGHADKAKPYLDMAAQAAPTHIDVRSRQQPELYNTQPRHQVSVGYGRSTLDRTGFSNWHDRSLEYRHLSADGDQQYLRAEHNARFDRADTMLEAGLTFGSKGRLPIEVAVGYTPQVDFMARYFARVQASTPLTDGSSRLGTVIMNALFQYSSYVNGNTKRLQAGLEWYVPGTDVWLTPAIGMVSDQDGIDTFAWSLGLHWQAGGTTRLGASYSEAPETENMITRDSTSTSVYWRQDLGAAWVLYLTWTRIDLDTLYVRRALDLSLQHRF